jgi:hypothetical protein
VLGARAAFALFAFASVGGTFAGLFYRSNGERQQMGFEAALTAGTWQQAVAQADAFMEGEAGRHRVQRVLTLVFSGSGPVVQRAVLTAFQLRSTMSTFSSTLSPWRMVRL